MDWKKPGLIATDNPIFPWMILLNTTLITIIGTLISIAPNIASLVIRGALQLSSDEMRWVSIGFIMTLGIVLPLGVWLAGRFGYKKMFVIGIVVFIVGLLFSACCFDFWSCLIGRNIMGLGAGIIFPLSNAMIAQVFPKERLSMALALYIGCAFGFGTAAGHYMGGICTQYISWQSIFWISALASLPSLLLTCALHEESEPQVDK